MVDAPGDRSTRHVPSGGPSEPSGDAARPRGRGFGLFTTGFRLGRLELFDRLLELREGGTTRSALVDGRVVSEQRYGVYLGRPHFFELPGPEGRPRWIEVRFRGQGFFSTKAIVFVDGRARAQVRLTDDAVRLAETPAESGSLACLACGYALVGLPAPLGEIRCPECGRHHAVRWFGFADAADYERWRASRGG